MPIDLKYLQDIFLFISFKYFHIQTNHFLKIVVDAYVKNMLNDKRLQIQFVDSELEQDSKTYIIDMSRPD